VGYTLGNQAGNPNLGPEFTKNREIAAELSFFKGRLTIEATRYKQKSTKLIFAAGVSATTGITSQVKNAGTLTNNGVELGVSVTPFKTKSVYWNVYLAYTQFKALLPHWQKV
jgi:outer membrane receptor protein involved in Fe transport